MRVFAIGLYLLFLAWVIAQALDLVQDMRLVEPGSQAYITAQIEVILLAGFSVVVAVFLARVLRAPGPPATRRKRG